MEYKEDGKGGVVPCSSDGEMTEILRDVEGRRVGFDIIDGVRVSTVFLCLDHGEEGAPLLYETLVGDIVTERYATREEAGRGHAKWCVEARRDGSRFLRDSAESSPADQTDNSVDISEDLWDQLN